MLGDFITRSLMMLFGYVYPALECYKTVEKNRVEIDQLRFWCQYWIIIALLTAFERIGDVFVSWLPMYGEMKLAFIIYLWYPKTKGTSFVYETFLRPYVSKHETDIDIKMQELRARALDFAIFHWQNCADYGQTTFYHILQYLATQSSKKDDQQPPNLPPPPSATATIRRQPTEKPPTQRSSKKWPWTPTPSAPPMSSMKRMDSQSPKSNIVQEQLPYEIPSVATVVDMDMDMDMDMDTDDRTDPPHEETLRSARNRLKRSQFRPH